MGEERQGCLGGVPTEVGERKFGKEEHPGNADWGSGKGKQVLERGRPNTTDSGI